MQGQRSGWWWPAPAALVPAWPWKVDRPGDASQYRRRGGGGSLGLRGLLAMVTVLGPIVGLPAGSTAGATPPRPALAVSSARARPPVGTTTFTWTVDNPRLRHSPAIALIALSGCWSAHQVAHVAAASAPPRRRPLAIRFDPRTGAVSLGPVPGGALPLTIRVRFHGRLRGAPHGTLIVVVPGRPAHRSRGRLVFQVGGPACPARSASHPRRPATGRRATTTPTAAPAATMITPPTTPGGTAQPRATVAPSSPASIGPAATPGIPSGQNATATSPAATATAVPPTETALPTSTATSSATATEPPSTATEPPSTTPTATATTTPTATATVHSTSTSTSTPSATAAASATATSEPPTESPPSDLRTVAPPLDASVSTSLISATQFLYSGPDAVQSGVASGTIEVTRTAVLRGQVLGPDGAPLAGVTIIVLGHPEFGQTISRASGQFDLAVNGGGLLTVSYAKDGYLPAQRQVQAPWQDYALLPDVHLVAYDPHVTTVDLSSSNSAPMQVAQGSMVSDADGTRQATLLFPAGTTAVITRTDGTTATLATLHVRATEYTVGANGPAAMPGELPPSSGYTYAADFSVDEAVAAGAVTTTFSHPIPVYVRNFLGFPVGSAVPAGYYDRQRGQWIPSTNGLVIGIVDITTTNGISEAELDLGAGQPATPTMLAAQGITDAELAQLAQLYQPGQSFWRVPISHFSAWDFNWGKGPPPDAQPPKVPPPNYTDVPIDHPTHACGSIIGCQTQTLGEAIPLAGTGYALHYDSGRAYHPNTLVIPLSGATVPGSLKRIELEIAVVGRRFTQAFPAAPNQSYRFTWDGTDAYGRVVQGQQPVAARIGYVYPLIYTQPSDGPRIAASGLFGHFSYYGSPVSADRTRAEVTLYQDWRGAFGRMRTHDLGGWTLDVQHSYDPGGRVLYLGDGEQRGARSLLHVITTVAGDGSYRYGGDGGPATQAELYSPERTALGPDGSFYIADHGNNRIRRVAPDGTITTVAGDGNDSFGGDGGPATKAQLEDPEGVAVGPDGSLYIADSWNNRIRRVAPDGIISTVAGDGSPGCSNNNPAACSGGDGGPAGQAHLYRPQGLAVGPDGSLYITDYYNNRIRAVLASGGAITSTSIITTVAGSGGIYDGGYSGDGGPATQARLSAPQGVAVGVDGSLYIADSGNNRIRQVGPDGIITTVAGDGSPGCTYYNPAACSGGDGGPAIQAHFYPADVALGPDGSLYIADGSHERVREVLAAGGAITTTSTITTMAGTGAGGYSGDGGPATAARLFEPQGVAVGPDGSLYIADRDNNRVRRVAPDGTITTVAGNGSDDYGGDGGPATAAHITYPQGIAPGPDGSLYIADGNNRRIRRVSADGTITTVAGNGAGCYPGPCGDGGPATQAALGYPNGVALGPDGSLYIAEYDNRIRRVGPDGIITTVAGTSSACYPATAPCGDGGPATQAQLSEPSGVAIGPDGSLYIADRRNNRVRRIAPDGIMTTVAGTGVGGYGGDGGPAAQAQLSEPSGVAVGPDGSLYIADRRNSRIRRVGPDGIITTVAGTGLFDYNGDGGPATAASIGDPWAVAVGPDGSLYIADDGYNHVRQVTPDGTITTVAGSAATSCDDSSRGVCAIGDGGPATAALLNSPEGVAVGPDGSLYIADSGYSRIQRLQLILPGITGADNVIPSRDGSQLYVFDGDGRHLRTVDALSGATRYQFGYDDAGRLATVTDGATNVTRIERDDAGNPTAIVAPGGQRTALTLDANGYLAAIADPLSRTTLLTTTATGLLTGLSDPAGYTHTFSYDDQGRLTRDADPAGGSSTLARIEGATGYTVTLTSALGRVTAHGVERLPDGGERLATTDPAGGRTVTDTGADGSQTVTYPDGTVVRAAYGPDPRWGMQAPVLISQTVTTPVGVQVTLAETRTARLADPHDPLSLRTLTDVLSLDGRTASTVYDAATRTYTTTTATGRERITHVDALGRPLREEMPGLLPVHLAYDARGRLATRTQGMRTWRFSYDAANHLIGRTDPLSATTGFGYDTAGQLTLQTLSDGQAITSTYDPNGNLATLSPPGQPAHTLGYTPLGFLSSYTPPDVGTGDTTTRYSYNVDRQVARSDRPDGATVTHDYDGVGRLRLRTDPLGSTGYSYDSAGRTTAITTSAGIALGLSYDGALLHGVVWSGPVSGTVEGAYDSSLRLASTRVDGGPGIAYQYDPDGLLTQAGDLTLSRDARTGLITGTTLGAVSTSTGYDGYGALAGASSAVSGTTLWSWQNALDALGRLSALTETIGDATHAYTYTYDLEGRLSDVGLDGAALAHYRYDANGNRLSLTDAAGTITGAYDAQDRLTRYGATTYSYSADGALRGATAAGQTTTYSYDALGNLRAVSLPDGTAIGYLVDGAGRRVGKTVDGVAVQGFLYQDDLRPIAELDGSNGVVSRFVYGARRNVPAYMIKGGATYRLVTDPLGSVRLVVDATTGAVAQRLDYDAFGRVTRDTSPGFQPFGYAGGLYDRDTGLVHFGSRDYDPVTGRWTTKDPSRFAGGSTNLYAYADDQPTDMTDPSGLAPGDAYDSQDAAAQAALDDINATSMEQNTEYAGLIYLTEDGHYSYTAPGAGTRDSSSPFGPCGPRGAPFYVAAYHTHGADDADHQEQYFSAADLQFAEYYGIDAYVATPQGGHLEGVNASRLDEPRDGFVIVDFVTGDGQGTITFDELNALDGNTALQTDAPAE